MASIYGAWKGARTLAPSVLHLACFYRMSCTKASAPWRAPRLLACLLMRGYETGELRNRLRIACINYGGIGHIGPDWQMSLPSGLAVQRGCSTDIRAAVV